jgi:fibronectin-binding autotransporter adhesin
MGTLGVGIIQFLNAATAGDGTVLTALRSSTNGAFSGSEIHFYDTCTASSATIAAEGAKGRDHAGGGLVNFHDNTTAANANITATSSGALRGGSGQVFFSDDSTAANATFSVEGGDVFFGDNSQAATAQFTISGGSVNFDESASAADATFSIEGGMMNFGIFTVNGTTPTAGNGLFTISSGAFVTFWKGSSGSNVTLIANGGGIFFWNEADGGEGRIELFLGDGTLDITNVSNALVSVGSIEGDGMVLLSTHKLITGSNDLSTTFSGTIQDSGDQRFPGSLKKIGRGTLTLSGANTYAGATTVNQGGLVLENTTGSATGTGPVTVNAGTLGGSGIITGTVTVGTGSGSGAFLAPAAGTNVPATLTIQSPLTLNSNATYAYTFKAKRNTATTDMVIANGVTINSGATLALSGRTRGALTQGLVMTVISNTSANPISGTFGNLPDGGIVTVNGNNLQANYEGGDGNDLTLTVVP